ncbi:zinc metalloprotease [Myxococcus fulvus]|uniref:zinc metalloprotease n=1 Tax=Myxococcus fulvus TaxID=33 RepID=UPI0020C15CBD|nr:zinc metalloprotease [Myxococcus fulvus]MCK8500157.1 zinc metalloprotease [Myxococcus fulvus]
MLPAHALVSSVLALFSSDVFSPHADRCVAPEPTAALRVASFTPSDCSLAQTVPGPLWQPTTVRRIPVVVHLISDAACANGNISDALVHSQITVLNEDFRALTGTPGAAGMDSKLEFFLATEDPAGNPTTGIQRYCNTTWYQDQGSYWNTIAWDPTRYLNLYTNSAGGSRGYVPFLPADPAGAVGQPQDRVVINWRAFGRVGPVVPYHNGRTVTHEVGHYLGLFHTYYEGCGIATAPACYTTGDRICDTAPNVTSHKGCPVGLTSCGGAPVPVQNYMELTDDACMTGFTAEQVQRMRCTLASYRSTLAQ